MTTLYSDYYCSKQIWPDVPTSRLPLSVQPALDSLAMTRRATIKLHSNNQLKSKPIRFSKLGDIVATLS